MGRYVTEQLVQMEEQVVTAGTNTQKLQGIFGDKVDPVYFDFTDKDTFKDTLEQVDRVFLMRPPHLGKPEDIYPYIDAMKE